MAVQPVSPKTAKKVIPDFVIEAVNELINENLSLRGFTIMQKHIIDRVKSKTDQDFDYAWLDFESVFEAAGWNVNYDKPAYCETYEPYFNFTPKASFK